MLFVNFKTYEEATGKKAVELAKICSKISKDIILVVQTVDIFNVCANTQLKVFAQHVDEVNYGSNTGSIIIDAVKQAGAKGTIINHSENRIPMDKIKSIVRKCNEKNFTVLVCAQDPDEVSQIAELNPDYIAYEPPELIGGNISVSSAKPEVIKESVEKAGSIPLIVGAGIKNNKDVKISMSLGAKGILVASGIVKSNNQEKAIKDLI